ncbi:MAG: queuosine precursor transporter [Thermodesulfobacteriota bacterium]
MEQPKSFRYLDLITGLFTAVLLISNVASSKIVSLGGLSFDGGTLLFPLAYIFGDVLTEVYGYARGRRVIWTGFFSLMLLSVVLAVVGSIPPDPQWPHAQAYDLILGQTPRIVLASLTAYFAGEFANSYVLAKMKVASSGKHLWMRTIGSTLVGEGLDTAVFVLAAFYGTLSDDLLWRVLAANYIFKVGVEVILTPVTYALIGTLKKLENEDFYDYATDFNPFRLGPG